MGAPPNWIPHLDAYFAIGAFASILSHGSPYVGEQDPEVDLKNCEKSTYNCVEYCTSFIQRSDPSVPRFSVGVSIQRSDPSVPSSSNVDSGDFPAYCRKSTGVEVFKCWDTSKFRCWNEFGGNMVFDGKKEWTLTRHFQGDEVTDMKWMHLFIDQWDLLIFGWGIVKPIEEICENMKHSKELIQLAQNMFPTQNMIIAGHSEGSGWAVCFSELLARQKEFHNKHFVIGSGSLVPKRQFHMRMSAATRINSLFLLVENRLPDSVIGGGLMPDVYPLLSVEEGLTFASFGFSCDESAKCIGASRIRLGEGLMKANTIIVHPDKMGLTALNTVIQSIHHFDNYRICFSACRSSFIRDARNFQANTPPYFKSCRPEEDEEKIPGIPNCKFC